MGKKHYRTHFLLLVQAGFAFPAALEKFTVDKLFADGEAQCGFAASHFCPSFYAQQSDVKVTKYSPLETTNQLSRADKSRHRFCCFKREAFKNVSHLFFCVDSVKKGAFIFPR